MNKVVTTQSTQTLLDLTLQCYGDADSVFDLAELNPTVNFVDDLTGTEITYPINNKYVQKYYIANEVTVSNKPIVYRNKEDYQLLCEDGNYLVQENTYEINL